MAESERLNDSVRAVDRALEILLAFTPADYELSPAEMLKRVNLSRPTLYRLLYTLEKRGFLASSGEPQKFRLGSAVARIAHVWMSSLDLTAVGMPIMRRVWEVTNETVGLFVPQGDNRLCVAEIPSSHPLSFKRGVGFQERLAIGASGRAILANAGMDPRRLRHLTQSTGLDVAAYAKQLESARRAGYAVTQDEQIDGATGVAVPFFDGSGLVAGSLAIYGPSVRFGPLKIRDHARLLITEVAHLSRALGFQPMRSMNHSLSGTDRAV